MKPHLKGGDADGVHIKVNSLGYGTAKPCSTGFYETSLRLRS